MGNKKLVDKMLQIVKKLSVRFPFVRVDFFEIPTKLYVSELTFYPGGSFTSYYPKSFNELLGDLLILLKKETKL